MILFPVLAELNSPVERRIKKLFSRSVIINMSVYLTAIIAGFLSLPLTAPELITDRKPLNGDDRDIAMNIGRLSMSIHLFTSIPLILFPSKNLIFEIRFLKEKKDNKFIYILVSFFLVYLTAGIAIIFPNIYDILSLMGGTGCVYMSITLPGLLSVRLSGKNKKHWKNVLIYTFTGTFTVIGLVAGALSFLRGIGVIDF